MRPDERHESQARQALEAWAPFPADRQPRPIVLLDPPTRAGSFPDGQKKLAFLNGAVAAVPGFPDAVLEALRGRPRGYPGPPLLLTAATLGSALYATDRGPQRLPSWSVSAQDVPDPLTVLDPGTAAQTWEPPGQRRERWRGTRAELGPDGRTLVIRFTGSPRAYTDYTGARVLESGNAVALIYQRSQKPAGRGWRTAIGETREVTALLAVLLGNRVVLDATGSPVMVTPQQPRTHRETTRLRTS
jgi:hypothetical protein